jgi:DNA-binding transcriptional regulator YdaS (Cro superfamily)
MAKLKRIEIAEPPSQREWRAALREAIAVAGTQQELSLAIGVGQGRISWLVNECVTIPAEMAKAISDVTDVPLHKFRPDLWEPPVNE